jgi:hypothetical protein
MVDDRCKRLTTWAAACEQIEPADARLAAAT